VVCWVVAGRTGPISAVQVAVLLWLADGCPAGVMAGHGYKTVALALQSRRLATIGRKRGVWACQRPR
jgi:hypothetical protein